MDKLIVAICLLMLMCSCGGGKKNEGMQGGMTTEVDSLTLLIDSIIAEEILEEEVEMPAKADESFDDFLYNFALDDKMQLSRIVFPLPYYRDDRKDSILKEDWTYDPLFSQLDMYSVLYDKVEDMDIQKDTALTSAKIEWIYLQTKRIKKYYFERIRGEWTLEAIDDAVMPDKRETDEDFFEFYSRFVNDSLFQAERVVEPLKFVTVDPGDEFQVMEATLEKGQWFAFQPALSREWLTNVCYGQPLDADSRIRIVELKGFGNGFSNTLYFHRRQGIWKLTKFEDLGD